MVLDTANARLSSADGRFGIWSPEPFLIVGGFDWSVSVENLQLSLDSESSPDPASAPIRESLDRAERRLSALERHDHFDARFDEITAALRGLTQARMEQIERRLAALEATPNP